MGGYCGRNSGFSLLEVLVAVVVLSTGLLGLAGLQVSGLRFNHSAYLRTQATFLAYEMADRIRANQPMVEGSTNGGYPVRTAPLLYDAMVGVSVAACETTAGCTTMQMAQNDVFRWQQTLSQVLPNGQGVVCFDAVPVEIGSTPAAPSCGGGTTYAIKVWWDDRGNSDDPNALNRFVVTLTQ